MYELVSRPHMDCIGCAASLAVVFIRKFDASVILLQ